MEYTIVALAHIICISGVNIFISSGKTCDSVLCDVSVVAYKYVLYTWFVWIIM